jgi:phenylpropionate dioxygenase-like ring-hydroxylating dioxygenase large terminal subunit
MPVSDRIPLPPYPNGWFAVCDTDELEAGQVKPIHYLGRDLVLYRGEDGEARVFDAFCPHLGAHLGYGGAVEGNSLRCPFHAWRFGPDGACVEVPYARKVPPRARVHAWTSVERSGAILVWHHAGGAQPSWQVPEVPEWGSDEWSPPTRTRYRVRTHAQEMA